MDMNVMAMYVSHTGGDTGGAQVRLYQRGVRYGRLYVHDCMDVTRREVRDAITEHLEGSAEYGRMGGGVGRLVDEIVGELVGEYRGHFVDVAGYVGAVVSDVGKGEGDNASNVSTVGSGSVVAPVVSHKVKRVLGDMKEDVREGGLDGLPALVKAPVSVPVPGVLRRPDVEVVSREVVGSSVSGGEYVPAPAMVSGAPEQEATLALEVARVAPAEDVRLLRRRRGR